MLTAQELVGTMRRERSDLPNVEAKSASGGYPTSLDPTMSALSNLPGGGCIVLGIAEDHGFNPVPLGDTNALRQTLTSKARQGTTLP